MNAPTTDPSPAAGNAPPESTYFYHNWDSDDNLTAKIVAEVAELSEKGEAEIELLYDRIDPDCLDTIFAPCGADRSRSDATLFFSLEECNITIYGSGLVILQRRE